MAGDQSHRQSDEQSPNSVLTVTTSIPADRKLKDVCFKCGKQGHWAQDCPSNGPTPKSSSPSPDTHSLKVLRCHCGVACTVFVSHCAANNGRKYYSRNCKCDNVTQPRNFYKWCDLVKAPMCICGAGACTINIQRDEKGKDTKYYTCRIRTGHGSCGFLQFENPPNTPNSCPRTKKKIDKRPLTSSPPHGDPPNIKTRQISAPGNSPNDSEASTNAFGNDTRPLGDPLRTSSLGTSSPVMGKGVPNTIRKDVQEDPLTHLESMEKPDNDTMLQATNDTFDASVSPLIQCGHFVERLVESIQGISIVTGMGSTLQDNCNQEMPTLPKNIEKCLYDFQSVHETASRVKDALSQIEKLETFLLKTAKDVGHSKRCRQATYQELTEALKLPQEKQEHMQQGQH